MADFEKVSAALDRVPLLHRDFHGKIYEELKASGCLGGGISASASAVATTDPRRERHEDDLLRLACAEARRIGVDISKTADGPVINVNELNRVLAGKDPEKRIHIKSILAAAGLIP